jgi:hypothetical protein
MVKVKRLRGIGVETRLKGYKYFEIERDFFNKFGVLIDGDFKFGCTAACFCSFPWRRCKLNFQYSFIVGV